MTAKRVLLLVFGSIATLVALALLAGGGILLWAHETKRDSDGFYTSEAVRFETTSYALASEDLDVADVPDWLFDSGRFATIRLSGSSVDAAKEIFIGVGREQDVTAYLSDVEHDLVTDVDFDDIDLSDASITYQRQPGEATPEPPASQTFWAESVEGGGTQTLDWEVEEGSWSIVVMNADASPGVVLDLSFGAKVGFILGLAIGLLAGGAVLLLAGATMIYFGGRSGPPPTGPEAAGGPAGVAAAPSQPERSIVPPMATYPVAVEGELDPNLSRWLWLVKWLLAIPHYIVLFFLWIAFVVTTIIAFFAILFTERYPRGIFDFNVGVLRWTWRVSFYSYSALATDRYPPFTLGPVPDYPATLDVPYPERLSRGLVLVKWWLLAIPHYIVVGIFGGGWWWGGSWWWGDDDWGGWGWGSAGGGLIGILVIFAAVVLLFKGRYPRDIFDLVLGLNRWSYRVWAYAGLMRDEYPPFRLELGSDRRHPETSPGASTITESPREPGVP